MNGVLWVAVWLSLGGATIAAYIWTDRWLDRREQAREDAEWNTLIDVVDAARADITRTHFRLIRGQE